MKLSNRQQGQTLIETALILLVIMIIVFGLVEFARAWFTKNSLKNAVRNAARMAVVQTSVVDDTAFTSCVGETNPIKVIVCTSPGVPDDSTTVSVDIIERSGSDPAQLNDTIKVTAQNTFDFILGGSILPWGKSAVLNADASMRYEL
jgi:Flp pilus assembly protein TadG